METLTQTLVDASLMIRLLLVDSIQVYNLGAPTTSGFTVGRAETAVGDPIPALVQTTVLANAVESRVTNEYSVKVAQGTSLTAGQMIKVVSCIQEPSLVGKKLLLDKVSQNGMAVLRKAVASDFHTVDEQGKGGL